jgi:hypothetical protein
MVQALPHSATGKVAKGRLREVHQDASARVPGWASPRVVLIGKPACHLCDQARAVVAEVCERLGVDWAEQSIFDDPALYDEYWERIPVTLVDGRYP